MIKQNKNISFYLFICFTIFINLQQLHGQYEGGQGTGFSTEESTTGCSFTSIFQGTSSDGFDFLKIIHSCEFNLFSSGGYGNGFTMDTTFQNCLLPSIFSGNSGDGNENILNSPCPPDSLVIETQIIQQPSCTSSSLGIAYVSIVNGSPYWNSTPDFTYIWKNESGDTLAGYPIVKSSTYDTVTNLNPGEYTIVIIDANLKIDSAKIYIADCLYRGGEGSGFYTDSSEAVCTNTSVFTNSGNDGSDILKDIQSCNFYLISKGGSGNGFALDSSNQFCLPPQIFKGERADGYSASGIILSCDIYIFSSGGNGNGFAYDTNTQNCQPLNIFKNTANDGFDYDSEINNCDFHLFTNGGNGNGFSTDTSTQSCSSVSIYKNSGFDGFDVEKDLSNCESNLFSIGGNGNGFYVDTALTNCNLPNIYSGNSESGYNYIYDIPCLTDSIRISAEILDQITCPVTTNNGSAIVRILDGYPDWRSVPDYTIIWKNSAGDTLTGYPKTTSETTDTITNLGIDDYTIVVYDILGNIDSATVYVTDCLYRGGDGGGFNSDSSLTNCLPESIFKNSANDGFDYSTDLPVCNFGLFSSGGSGNGFDVDTIQSYCPLTSIYLNSGDDGFDYTSDTQICNMSLISSGGNGNGFSTDTSVNICNLPEINHGAEGDGADQLYNGCTPYIYDVPATYNTCLSADTITSDGSDEWQPIMLNGQIVAAIKDNGNNLGEITTEFYVNNNAVRIDPFGILPSYYLDRNFKLSSENLIFGDPVRVRLYFLSNELQALITADDDVTSINTIGITQYHGTNENCQLPDNIDNNDNLNYLYTATYDWETYENGYYIEFDITSFSELYINNSSSIPAPYQILATISVTSDYNGTDISCYGEADGEATITPTYGMAPFTYQWDDPLNQTDSTATGLSAGTYHVTVIDNNNVTYSDSITLNQPDSISMSSTSSDACAGENNGTIDITVNGGTVTTDYTYSWTTSDGSGVIAGNEDQYLLSEGEYYITVIDNNLCSTSDTINISELTQSSAATGIAISNNNTCSGSLKVLSPIGGTLGYNAQWHWYADASCTSLLYTGNSFSTDPANNTTYWLRAEGDCDTTSTINQTVLVLPASVAPDSISKSSDNIAPGTSDTLVVNGGTLGDGAAWKWYLDAGCTTSAGADNDTLIVLPMVTTQYWVRAEGTCNTTAMVTTIVTVNPLPFQPGTPVGQDTLCQNNTNTTYITSGASGATSYIWNIDPPEAGTISGTGTSATVDWSSTYYGSVSITVTGENISGTGPESDPIEIWIWKIPQSGNIHHISNTFDK